MPDHYHDDHAPAVHEHGYYELAGVAEEHHRHYDLERRVEDLEQQLVVLRAELEALVIELADTRVWVNKLDVLRGSSGE